MIVPIIATRVEQADHLLGLGIDTCDVRPFVGITPITTQTEIVGLRSATMLTGDDVIDGKRKERILILLNKTVFAAVTRTLADEIPQSGIHHKPSGPSKVYEPWTGGLR